MVICAEHTGVVDDHNDLLHLRVDATFADVPRPDVLPVSGGRDRGPVSPQTGTPIVDWIRQAADGGRCHHPLERLRRPCLLRANQRKNAWSPPGES